MEIIEKARNIIKEKEEYVSVPLPIEVERSLIGGLGDEGWDVFYHAKINGKWSADMNSGTFLHYVKDACNFLVRDITENYHRLNGMLEETPLRIELASAYTYRLILNGETIGKEYNYEDAIDMIDAFLKGWNYAP